MSEEATQPKLEVVSGGAGEAPKQDNLGDMGGTPPKQEAPPTPKQEADARAALLDAYGVKSTEELNYVLSVAEVGHKSLLEQAKIEKEKERSTQEGQEKQRGRVDFLAKYGDRLVQGPKGQLLVPPDVMQDALEDMKTEARKIAREESEGTLTAAERKRAKIQQQEYDGHQKFWNDPKNQDLLIGNYVNDEGKEINAADEVQYLVNNGIFKPGQAALHVREKMKLSKRAQEFERRSTERNPRYEDNVSDEIDVKSLPAPLRRAKESLDGIKKKPEGERGSDAFFDMFEDSRRWS